MNFYPSLTRVIASRLGESPRKSLSSHSLPYIIIARAINNGQTITKSSMLNKQSIKKANYCLFKVNCIPSSNMQTPNKQ